MFFAKTGLVGLSTPPKITRLYTQPCTVAPAGLAKHINPELQGNKPATGKSVVRHLDSVLPNIRGTARLSS
jgi:hypothetical protein